MTNFEIMFEGLKTYWFNPQKRSFITIEGKQKCAFNGENNTHCIVGQFIPEELKQLGQNLICNTDSVDVLLCNYEKELEGHLIINENNLRLLEDLQFIHDSHKHWNIKGITNKGLKYIKAVCDNFDVDYDKLIEKLNNEAPKKETT